MQISIFCAKSENFCEVAQLKSAYKKQFFFAHIKLFSTNLRSHFQNGFTKLFFCFLFNAQHSLETCVNCVWNCVTPLFTPLRLNFQKIFFSKTYCSLILNAVGDIWTISRRRLTELTDQGPYKSQFSNKWVGTLPFRENGLAITLTWPNKP